MGLRFFAVAALFAFDVCFVAFDLFLEFVLVDFFHEFSSGDVQCPLDAFQATNA